MFDFCVKNSENSEKMKKGETKNPHLEGAMLNLIRAVWVSSV